MKVCTTLLLALTTPVFAASWYVDNAASGSNNGTSWSDAWQSHTNVVWGGAGVIAGDTLYTSGGSTSKSYVDNWTVGASGTAGNPITIRVGQEAGHNGKVIFDRDSEGDYGTITVLGLGSRHNITIDGSVGLANHLVFQNLRNITNRSMATAINASTATTNVIVQFVNFTNINNGISFNDCTGHVVRHCNLSQVRGDGAIRMISSKGGFDANLVYSNFIGIAFSTNKPPGGSAFDHIGADGVQISGSASVFNNTIRVDWNTNIVTSTQHPDSIQCAGDFTKIYNNSFINIGDAAIMVSYAYTGDGTYNDILIYNNLIWQESALDSLPEFIRFLGNTPATPITTFSNVHIWNNTLVNNTNWVAVWIFGFEGDPTAQNCSIQNNLWYNCGSGTPRPMLAIAASTNFTAADWNVRSNLFYNTTTQYVSLDGTNYTVADWVTSNGSSVADPLFASATDFRLQSTSPAIGAGTNLSAYFTTDKNGVARGSTWDIGAYEFAATSTWNIGTLNAVTTRAGSVSSP